MPLSVMVRFKNAVEVELSSVNNVKCFYAFIAAGRSTWRGKKFAINISVASGDAKPTL